MVRIQYCSISDRWGKGKGPNVPVEIEIKTQLDTMNKRDPPMKVGGIEVVGPSFGTSGSGWPDVCWNNKHQQQHTATETFSCRARFQVLPGQRVGSLSKDIITFREFCWSRLLPCPLFGASPRLDRRAVFGTCPFFFGWICSNGFWLGLFWRNQMFKPSTHLWWDEPRETDWKWNPHFFWAVVFPAKKAQDSHQAPDFETLKLNETAKVSLRRISYYPKLPDRLGPSPSISLSPASARSARGKPQNDPVSFIQIDDPWRWMVQIGSWPELDHVIVGTCWNWEMLWFWDFEDLANRPGYPLFLWSESVQYTTTFAWLSVIFLQQVEQKWLYFKPQRPPKINENGDIWVIFHPIILVIWSGVHSGNLSGILSYIWHSFWHCSRRSTWVLCVKVEMCLKPLSAFQYLKTPMWVNYGELTFWDSFSNQFFIKFLVLMLRKTTFLLVSTLLSTAFFTGPGVTSLFRLTEDSRPEEVDCPSLFLALSLGVEAAKPVLIRVAPEEVLQEEAKNEGFWKETAKKHVKIQKLRNIERIFTFLDNKHERFREKADIYYIILYMIICIYIYIYIHGLMNL